MPCEFQEKDTCVDGKVYRNINGNYERNGGLSKTSVCLETAGVSFVITSANEVVIGREHPRSLTFVRDDNPCLRYCGTAGQTQRGLRKWSGPLLAL